MTSRRIRFTATAQRHVRREKAWWIENRIHREVFAAEFEEALRVLALLPGAGTAYPQAGIAGLRRLYVPKITCHLYYTFDEHDVIVRALGLLAGVAVLGSGGSYLGIRRFVPVRLTAGISRGARLSVRRRLHAVFGGVSG